MLTPPSVSGIVRPGLAPPRRTVSFAADLARHGGALAAVTADGREVTYAALAAQADAAAGRLGPVRRLVAVRVGNDLGSLVAYLAALRGGHAVLLVPPDAGQSHELLARYEPDAVCASTGTDVGIEARRDGTAHELHPDLCLLLSTSGSTGSPKLVRLSHANLESNAAAIASYLGIRGTDRAATTLPMHYCYGLSVVHSHLARGAALLLGDDSVVDASFWVRFRAHRGTTFAGVPYTFELLDRIGFASMDLPDLRYVTQAGGRLPPEVVGRYAELGRRRGWDLFVMYGQTEATARMAYLPPDLALTHPGAIGVPVPGGSFELDPRDGELCYRGPNVMLGYAERPADLALGRTIDVLRTGDLARRNADGLYEVTGRKNRLVKIFGRRIDLSHLEQLLERSGTRVHCAGTDEFVVVAVPPGADDGDVARRVAGHTALPLGRVRVCDYDRVPRLANGKVDYRAICERARRSEATHATDGCEVRSILAGVLHVDPVPDDATFVSLGGDSLSYVEASVLLEDALGFLPHDWHVTPVGQLRALAPAPRVHRARRIHRTMETSVVLRAASILLVVMTHVGLVRLQGGAHLLLLISGYNFARFGLVAGRRPGHAGMIVRVALPTAACVALTMLAVGRGTVAQAMLVGNYLGGVSRYWFVEVLVQLLAVLALTFAIPAVRQLEKRAPFGVASATFVATAAAAVAHSLAAAPRDHLFTTHLVAWIFVLGWLIERARTVRRRMVVCAAGAAVLWPFFAQTPRGAVVIAGMVVLAWVPRLPVPRRVDRVVAGVAAASLFVYLTHFELYPLLTPYLPAAVVTALVVAAGVGAHAAFERATRAGAHRIRAARQAAG